MDLGMIPNPPMLLCTPVCPEVIINNVCVSTLTLIEIKCTVTGQTTITVEGRIVYKNGRTSPGRVILSPPQDMIFTYKGGVVIMQVGNDLGYSGVFSADVRAIVEGM